MPRCPPLGEKMMKELMSQILGDSAAHSDRGDSDDEEGVANGNMEVRRSRREPVMYTREQLLRLSQSPHVKAPTDMPRFEDWYGEWRDVTSPAAKHGFPQHYNGNPATQDRNRTKRGGKNGAEGEEYDGGAGEGKYGRGGALNSGRPRNAPYRSFNNTSPTNPSSALPGSSEPERRERKWEKPKGPAQEGGEEGENFGTGQMGRFGLSKGKLAAEDVNGRAPRTRGTRGEGKDRERTDEVRPELGATSRSDGAADWRRGAGPSRLEPSGPSSRWKDSNGNGRSSNYNQHDDDRVPEWMMDDPAVAAIQPKAKVDEESLEAFGQTDNKKKKLRGLEELQAQNDEIAAYRAAMKDKEKRRRGEVDPAPTQQSNLPPLEDPAIAAQIAAPHDTTASFLLPTAKSRAPATMAIPEAAPVAGGRGSRFAKFFDAPAISQDPARSTTGAPSSGASMSPSANAQMPDKTQGLAALLGIKAAPTNTPRPNDIAPQAPPIQLRQEASPSPLAGGLMLNGMQSGQRPEGRSSEHMSRLLGMLKGPNDGPMPAAGGIESQGSGAFRPPHSVGPSQQHQQSHAHIATQQPPPMEAARGSMRPQSPARSRETTSHGPALPSPVRGYTQQGGPSQVYQSNPMPPPHSGAMQGQNLLAQLQGNMPAHLNGHGPQGGYPSQPLLADQHRNSQQQMLARMAADSQLQSRSPMGPPLYLNQGPPPNSMGVASRGQEPAPSPAMQKQMSFWQLANQLHPPSSQPVQQAPPPPPQGPGYMPQYAYGGPMPPPPISNAPMPYLNHQQGIHSFGQQGPPPAGMMLGPNGMGGQQYGMQTRAPPPPPHHMNPELMAILGGMQARPQA